MASNKAQEPMIFPTEKDIMVITQRVRDRVKGLSIYKVELSNTKGK